MLRHKRANAPTASPGRATASVGRVVISGSGGLEGATDGDPASAGVECRLVAVPTMKNTQSQTSTQRNGSAHADSLPQETGLPRVIGPLTPGRGCIYLVSPGDRKSTRLNSSH